MKVALITGAGRGWGERLARELAARGFHIVANDIHPAAAERTAERIRTAGGSAEPFHADVANRVAVGAMVQEILDRWGPAGPGHPITRRSIRTAGCWRWGNTNGTARWP
jgi:NAD(P)-dependent dehydrogenase (short-subunit alcohol dehydrogenase family)